GSCVDEPGAVPVLAGDLPAGVHDQELGLVVGELQLLHGQGPTDADAAGDRVLERRVHDTGGGVDRGQGAHRDVVELGEPATDVQRRVRRGQRGRLVVGGAAEVEGGHGCARGRVD